MTEQHAEIDRIKWRLVFEDLYEGMANEQTKRDQRRTCDPVTHRPDWLDAESAWMLARVNHHRADLGLPPVTAADIDRAEQTALGHVDYTKKWALACADLTFAPVTSPDKPAQTAATSDPSAPGGRG